MRKLLLLLLAGFTGCSALVDTSDLASEPATGGATSGGNGGSGGTAASGGTATSGGGNPSGGTGNPGGAGGSGASDAGADADGAPNDASSDAPNLGFCQSLTTSVTLCADFDSGSYSKGWDSVDLYGQCTMSTDTSASVSAPGALSVAAPTFAQFSDQCSGSLHKTLPKPSKVIHVEFDLRPEALDSSAWTYAVSLVMNGTGTKAEVVLRLHAGQGAVSESVTASDGGVTYAGHIWPDPPALGKWTHIQWDIDVSGAVANSTLTQDGKSSSSSLNLKPYVSSGDLGLGITFASGPTEASKLRFDNVVIDVD